MGNLSVFIPTFNRPASLVAQMERFLPQLGDTPITVVDNASDEDMKEVLPSTVRYIRNSVNVGATANVLRCFELCETDWIWICGDDDPVLPDAIKTAHAIIEEFSEACYVSTTSRLVTYRVNGMTSSIPQLLSLVADIGRLFWLTGNLYNVRQLRQYLRVANYLPNAAPQMVLVLMAMSQGKQAGVSTASISGHTLPTDSRQRWNEFEVLTYLAGLVDLPISLEDRKAIAASLADTILSFDEHFVRVLNAVASGASGAEDLVALYGSRWGRLLTVLDDMEKLDCFIARLAVLRDRTESIRILEQIGEQGRRPVEILPRFQRL